MKGFLIVLKEENFGRTLVDKKSISCKIPASWEDLARFLQKIQFLQDFWMQWHSCKKLLNHKIF